MGGHGGLNILPQKRWNVYNRDNRLKVARDEAKHAAQEQELQAKHKAAEAESRRKMLLQRAKERRAEVLNSAGLADEAAALGSLSAAAEESDRQDEYAVGLQQEADERRQDSIQQQQQQDQPYRQQPAVEDQQQPVLEHINFWKDLEAKAEDPDRQKERKDEFRKRGNPDTYTTDARFDESFQFGHGLAGPKPWYARAVDSSAEQRWETPAQEKQQMQSSLLPAAPAPAAITNGKHKQHSKRKRSASSSSDGSTPDSDSSREARQKRRKGETSRNRRHSSKEHKHRKSNKKDKHKKSSKHRTSSTSSAVDADKALALARLRAERLEREAAERHRSLVAAGQMPAPTKRYNSSYGYADALRAGAQGPANVATARGAAAAAVSGLGERFRS